MTSQQSPIGVSVQQPASSQIARPEQELSFVHLTSKPLKSWRSNNKVVRAHVMRRYKREQRTKALEQTIRKSDLAPGPATSPSSDAGASGVSSASAVDTSSEGLLMSHIGSGNFTDGTVPSVDRAPTLFDDRLEELPESGVSITFTRPDIGSWLDGSLNPFDCLPIPSTPYRLMLLRQNTLTGIRTSVHADPDDLWRRSCSSNIAWLFMTLFYAASRFPHISQSFPAEEVAFLVQSISAVNECISKSPSLISDATIATVACLANIDNLNGVSSDAAIHINGLIHMVQLRGGLNRLGMQGLLRRMVLWSDLLASSRLGKPPRFPFYQTDVTLHLSVYTPTVSADIYQLDLNEGLADIATARHHISIAQLMLSLHQLSTFLNVSHPRRLPWEAAYPDRLYEVEYHLLNALFDDQIVATTEEQLCIGQLLLHAGLLFIYTNLRETPVGGAIRCRLLTRLKAALAGITLPAPIFMAEMLWVFLLGASACIGSDRAYFVEQLRHLTATCNVASWSDARRLLERVPSFQVHRLGLCMDLWADIELSEMDPRNLQMK